MVDITSRSNRVFGFASALLLAISASDAAADSARFWQGMTFQAGGAVRVMPLYEGANQYRVVGLPLLLPVPDRSGLAATVRRRVEVKSPDNVRIKMIASDWVEAGPVVGYAFGREEEDDSRLAGLGDLDGGPVAGAFLALGRDYLRADVSFHKQIAGDVEGFQIKFGAGGELPITEGSLIGARIGATYADTGFMNSYFGVSAAQAMNSGAGLRSFAAGGGIKDINVEVYARLGIGRNWSLRPTLRYARLLHDAERSPLVETPHQLSGGLALTYRFQLP